MPANKWPCVFRGPLIRAVDAQVQSEWLEARGQPAPFGALRRIWRDRHCQTINPYGSDSCPYEAADCQIAFLVTVQRALTYHEPRSAFGAVAHRSGLDRSENKPLARDRISVHERPGKTRDRSEGPVEGPGLRGGESRPQRIGELLGSLDLRSHQGRPTSVEEGTKR